MLNNSKNERFIHSIFESLEERVLFDGVPDATFILPQPAAAEPIPEQVQSLEQADISVPRELILIDAGFENSEQLLTEILESRPNSALEIRMIDADSDGIEQISAILAESEGQFDAIHIISEGDEGVVQLGNASLTADNLAERADDLAGWADALTEDADLIFYGSNLASEAGGGLIESISGITGADVTAFNGLTVSADLSGDSDGVLEIQPLTAAASATLVDTDGDGINDGDDLDDDNDGILDTEEGFVAEVTAPIDSTALNSPGFPTNTPLQTGNTAQLDGLFNGLLDFNATLINEGTGTPGFVGGIQIQPDPVLGGDLLFVQPDGTADFPNDAAQYTFDFNNPVDNLSFIASGINFGDTIIFEAFFEGNPVPITPANFSNFTDGVIVQNGNELFNETGAAGTAVDENRTTVTFTQPVDQIIATTGKGNGSNGTVTLGFNSFSGDVIVSPASFVDTDGDGVADHLDLDSDNDGISDLVESGADASVVDINNDGINDGAVDPVTGVPVVANGGAGVSPVDSDLDGVDDYLDLDSDNDGIADAIEAQPTAGYTSPAIGSDADGDGIVDTFDSGSGHGGAFTVPEDTDGDGTADFLDDDSDNDGIDDIVESGLTPGADNNGDGIADNIAPLSYADTDGIVTDPAVDLANQVGDTTEVGFREVGVVADKDWDGIPDDEDADADGDGILDIDEGALPTFTNGNFASGVAGWTTTGPIEFVTLTGGPDAGTDVAQLDNNNATASLSQVIGGADTSISEFQFDFGWNNGTQGGAVPFGQNIEVSVNGVVYLTITTPDDGNTNTDDALDQGGDALVVASNGASFTIANPSAQGPEFIDHSNFREWDLTTITVTLPTSVSAPELLLESGPRPGNGGQVSDDFAISGFTITEGFVPVDTDGDGISNHCDIDSDNDGISDLLESGNELAIAADTDGSGVIDNAEAAAAGFTDADGDGAWDQLGAAPVDTDMDGVADFLDLDSDNDGIADAVEAQPTAGYESPSIGSDADGDGVVDTFDDPSVEHGGAFATPEDTDGDGTFDFLDTDSDNDGIDDTTESGLTPGADNNGDGIADNLAPDSYADTDGIINDPSTDLANETGDTSEVAYREVVADLVTVKTLTSSDATPDEGDTVTFQIQVTNNGGGQATNVSLTDSLPAGITFTGSTTTPGTTYDQATGLFDIGTLNVGDTATLTLTGTVDVGQGGNIITNVTTAAMGDQDDPSMVGDDLIESVTVNDAADLITVKTLASGDDTPAEGDIVTFQIDVTNDGGAQATNVSLTDSLPAGITFTGSTTTAGTTYDQATGLFDIGTLNVGDTATLTLTGTVDAGQGGNTITNITTAATGDQIDPSDAGDDLEEAVVIDNTTDLVTVKTLASGNDTPDEGDIVTFDITVSNSGPITATNVSLTDLLPAGITFTGSTTTAGTTYDQATGLFDIGTLNVGDTATLTLTGTVDVGQGGNTITNITTAATGDQVDPSTAGDDLEESVTVNDAADLVTVKTLASGDATPAEGDTVTFQIDVTNNGGAQATNVSLTDSLPAGITFTGSTTTPGTTYDQATGLFDIGTLNVGDTATLTLTGTVDAGQGGNTITNITTAATGDQIDPSDAGDDLEEAVVIDNTTDLVTVKTLASGNDTPDEGDTVTFDITVTNSGPINATNVSLTDSLPAGITFTGSTTTAGTTYDQATGLFDIGTLNVGDTATLTLTGTVDVGQGGNTITNITTAATGDQVDPSTAGDDLEESVVVNDAADLVTVKTLASGDAAPAEGDTVTFQIDVTNNGGAQATNVSLTDSLPAGITFTGSTTTPGTTYDQATGLFDIGTLNVGDTATLTLTGTVDAGQGGNTITNITTAATGDQIDPSDAGDDLEEAVVIDNTTDLVTVKTLASGNDTPDEGDTVTFDITVTNSGPINATNVSLTDSLPAGITFTGSTTTAGTTYDQATGLFDIGTLNVGDTATLTLTGTVDVGQGGNTITNITTAATGDQVDPSTAGDDLEESVVVNDAADLVTVKTLASGDATPAEGDTVTFQIDVTNNGGAQATNVSLIDSLPAGITFTGSTVSQGGYDEATGLFDIGTLNVGEVATLTLSGTVDVGQGGNTITNITTAATGDQIDPSTVGDDLEESVDVVDNTTDLVTVKTLASGDATPEEGDIVTFDITVTNDGPGIATNISLTDLLPAGLTATGNNGGITQGSYDAATGLFEIGTLLVGETATLTLEGTVDAGQGGNTITNITTAAVGDQVDPSTVGDDLEESVVVGIPAADLVTVKTLASGDATPDEGDTVIFQITVTNDGPDAATGVSLTDSLPAGLTFVADTVSQGTYDPATGLFDIGTLASGATATLTLEGTVDVGQGGNTITNITTAAVGDQVDPSTAGDDLEESVVVNDAADLVTVKTLASGDATPEEGDIVTFQIDVTNNGGAQATNVSLIDSLPPGITLTGGTTSQGSYDVATGLFDIGTLNVGEIATLTLTGTVDAGQGGNTITNITTAATGDQIDPSTVGDDLEESVNVVDNTTDLITVKTLASGDATPEEGDIVTFDITVTNDGPGIATNISLTDLLPAGLTATGNNGGITQGSYDPATGLFEIGTLLVGETATLALEGTVDAGQGGNTITNITTAAVGDQVDPSTAGDDLEEAVVVGIPAADLVTVKTLASGDATPDEGDTVIFQITVTNDGPDAATGVSLTDSLPAGLTFVADTVSQGSYDPTTGLFDIGTLASGATATLTLEGTVDVGQGGNTITNITTAATGDQVDPSTAGDDLEESVVVNDAADLVTVKTLASGDATPEEGDIVTFQIDVTNNGGAQATNVSLIDSLPPGITLTGGTTSQGSYDVATGLFDIGTLNVGEIATLTLTGTVDAGQGGNTITNITTAATGDQIDPSTVGDDLEESVDVVDNTTDLITVKTLASGDATPEEGDIVTFDITVTNDGPGIATNISLTDLLPAGLTATGNNGGITQGSYDAATGLFEIGTLLVGETATLTLEGTVDAGQGGNVITNVTTAAVGDQVDPSTVGDDLEESVVVGIPAADLVTVKTLASGDATPDEGDTVIFQITVTNDGPDAATGVSLTDSLPAGLTFVADTVSQGTYDPATGLFDIGTLASGATATLTLEGTVDVGQGGNTITNITTAATGDQVDPSTAGDDLEESVVVNDAADLVTVKTLASGDATPEEGDTVTFQIDVTNNGGAQATNVSLIDSLPPGITLTGGTTSQGSYDVATGLFDIGTLNVGEVATLTLSGTVDAGQGGNTITNITTAATGDQIDPSTVGDDLEESVDVVDNTTDLVTVKTLASGDATPEEGDIVTFDITVTNDGPGIATNISLTDLLPAGLTATGNNGGITQGSYDPATGLFDIGTLLVGETATLTLEGTVDAGQGGNTITNITTAAVGDQVDPSTAGDDLEEAVVVGIPAADLVTVKTLASGDATPAEGDTVIFQITVTNDGPDAATGVSLTDSLPAGLTFVADTVSQGTYDPATGLFDIGTLASGATATLTLEGTVDVGQGGNTITNITTAATGDQVDPSTAGDDLEESVVVNDAADLVTVKTLASGDATPAEGDTVTFQIDVTNNGGAQATNVSLIDSLPPGITLTGGTTSQGSYDQATGLFDIGTLNVGEVATLTLTGTVDAGQGGNTITNITTAATGDQIDPSTVGDDLEESVDVVDNTTDLVTVKTLASGDATPEEGDIVTFDITVTNDGPGIATNISLTDLLPAGLTATGNNGGITQGSYDAATGLFEIGTLLVGETATLTLEGTVDAGQGGNTITNITTAAVGDQVDPSTAGDDLEEAVVVGVPAADLVTVKTLASGDATPDEGDTVIFQITVTNDGPDAATGVSLTDSLPAGLTFVADTVSQGTYDPATGLFDIGTLASGATATLTLEGTVDVGQGGNTITNITTAATGDQVDPSTAGDDLEESVVVNDAADLVTVKTLASGDATPEEGDTVTFQIDVTNNGGAQATNVSLIDSLPPGITLTGGTTSQGSYDVATGLFDIGTLNVGEVATLTLTGTVDAGQGGNTITNITTAATGDQIDPSTVGDDLEESVDVVDNTTDLITVKTLASGDATPEEGDIVTFDITVTNDGPGIATNISLTDLLPAGLTATGNNGGITQGSYDAATGLFDIGTLLVGETATLTLEGTVDAGQGGNTITNITTAAVGDQVDPSTVGDDLEEAVVVGIPAADLVTVKTLASGDATPDEGDTVIFQITVTNDGPDAATGVSLTDSLPAGLTFVADTVSQGTYDPATGLFDIGTLASGATATLTLEGTVDVGQGGNTITNITTAATGDQVDPSTAGDDLEESVVVNDAADLITVKTLASGDSTPAEGDIVTFQIDVTNDGAAQATNVSLIDSLPAGITFTGSTVSQGSFDEATGLFDIGTLNVGETATLTLSGTVDAGQGGNTITNVTTAATGDQVDPSTAGDDLDESVIVVVPAADLVTVKTLASGDSTPTEGDPVVFQITVTNDGPDTATNVSLVDLLPAGLTFTGSTTSQGTYDPATGLFDIGTLASGATATLTLEGTVDIGQGGNTITNVTTAATGDQFDPSTAGDDLDESVVVNNPVFASIGAAKELVGPATQLANGNFEAIYLVTVENTGNVDLANLTLTEDLANQFGSAFVNASDLAIVTGPANAGSVIDLNANFNGGSITQIVDTSVLSTLVAGDSFTFEFKAEIDASEAAGVLENTVVATGDAIDSFGNPILDEFGNAIVVVDNSDSGSDPSSNNAGEPGDTGTPDDPTPLFIAAIGLSKEVSQISPNGENFDVTFTLVLENTGNTPLGEISLNDDVASQFGSNFVGIVPGSLAIQNFVGSGSPPTVNTAFEGDTTIDPLVATVPVEIGASFEIVYTVTVDPDAVGGSGGVLVNQATATGVALNENDLAIFDANGDPIVVFDDSDNGADPTSENGSEDTIDGVFANDPTPVNIADISVAKTVVGTPVLTDAGTHIASFQVVIANNGGVDLANISLIEDIASQFGAAFVDAGNVTLVSGTTDALSSIQLNTGFDGNASNDLLDSSGINRLQVGDSFTVSFDVEIDSRQTNGILVNQITGVGNAIDANGNLITDSNGNVVTANDFSDSGTLTGSSNPGQPGDTGSPDDPTPVELPEIPTGFISGTVFNDISGDGIQQAGEAGIGGVLITLTGTDVFGDQVFATVLTDANGDYSFDGLNAGEYTITQTQPDGFIDGIDTGDPSFTVGNDQFSNISLGFGDSFAGITFAEINDTGLGLPDVGDPDTTPGFPPNLPSFATFTNLSVSSLLSGFTAGPGPIYSGIPINANANPLSLDSGQAVAGGYNVDNAISDPGSPVEVEPDCCEAPVEVCDPCNSAIPVEQPVQQIIVDECGCGPVLPTDAYHTGEIIEEGQPVEIPNVQNLGTPLGLNEPSFLKRFANWLSSADQA